MPPYKDSGGYVELPWIIQDDLPISKPLIIYESPFAMSGNTFTGSGEEAVAISRGHYSAYQMAFAFWFNGHWPCQRGHSHSPCTFIDPVTHALWRQPTDPFFAALKGL